MVLLAQTLRSHGLAFGKRLPSNTTKMSIARSVILPHMATIKSMLSQASIAHTMTGIPLAAAIGCNTARPTTSSSQSGAKATFITSTNTIMSLTAALADTAPQVPESLATSISEQLTLVKNSLYTCGLALEDL
ncbi:hypothetical protein QVD99_006248 [Batrachochytrium dendrobatidis]|nr:hypothetical protein O5D80_003408 [Batrachochytrium dendrobatidis]KAK5667032.1 hypothetical protein QVD99_006248 [Batrachochytrium dendrobatidis]